MTYVTEQTSQELRVHMRKLIAMKGWHEPLSDRLYKEILELDKKHAEIAALRKDAERYRWLCLQDLNMTALGFVIDAPHDGDFYIDTAHSGIFYGEDLGQAIDAAITQAVKP
tara:strand:+ start:118 stop:453 length:336 start_codon:yes stop_codon:yes gene_type:complete